MNAERSIGQLVNDLKVDLVDIVKHEVALAKIELSQSAKNGGIGAGLFAAAAYFASVAFILLCFAGAYGLVAAGLPEWAAFLIMTVVLLLVVAILGGIGYGKVRKVKGPKQALAANQVTLATLKGAKADPLYPQIKQ